MTIRDIVDNGIEIQGSVDVQYWDDEKEDEVRLFKSNRHDALIIFPDEVYDLEIKYMWARTELDENGMGDIPVIVIEVER